MGERERVGDRGKIGQSPKYEKDSGGREDAEGLRVRLMKERVRGKMKGLR